MIRAMRYAWTAQVSDKQGKMRNYGLPLRNSMPQDKFQLEWEVKNFAELFKGRYGYKKFMLIVRKLPEIRRFKSIFLAAFEIDFEERLPKILKADFNTMETGMMELKGDYSSDPYRIPRLIKSGIPDVIHKIQPTGGELQELWPRRVPRYRKQSQLRLQALGRGYPLLENLRKPIWRRPLTYEWREQSVENDV